MQDRQCSVLPALCLTAGGSRSCWQSCSVGIGSKDRAAHNTKSLATVAKLDKHNM